MYLIRGLQNIELFQKRFAKVQLIATIGNFDGLHLGHQKIISDMKSIASNKGYQTLVIFTEPHAKEFFAKKSLSPTVVIFTQEKQILKNAASKVGVKIVTVPDDRWRRRDIKTTQLLAQSLAKTHAVQEGVDDSLLVQGGFINEGSSSNVFIFQDERIITPSLSNDILGGITRSSVIKFCQINDIEIKEQNINIDDLMNAQEVFLTSATGFVLPVIEVNGRRVGNGLVGDTVKKIQQIYIEQIKAKLS